MKDGGFFCEPEFIKSFYNLPSFKFFNVLISEILKIDSPHCHAVAWQVCLLFFFFFFFFCEVLGIFPSFSVFNSTFDLSFKL